jgi:hypothetical protein
MHHAIDEFRLGGHRGATPGWYDSVRTTRCLPTAELRGFEERSQRCQAKTDATDQQAGAAQGAKSRFP